MDWDFRSDHNPQYSIEGVKFRFYTTDEVRALSVKEITNVETFDTLGHPNMGGLHDPSLGKYITYSFAFLWVVLVL